MEAHDVRKCVYSLSRLLCHHTSSALQALSCPGMQMSAGQHVPMEFSHTTCNNDTKLSICNVSITLLWLVTCAHNTLPLYVVLHFV